MEATQLNSQVNPEHADSLKSDEQASNGNFTEEELQKLMEQKKALESELKKDGEESKNFLQFSSGKEETEDPDERSIFVKNVDYSATEAELREHFQECGEIKRVTILHDKFANQPKGHAYIEFATKEGAMKSKRLNDSLFKGRQITILPKRKNVPGRGRGNLRGRNPMMQLAATMFQMMAKGGRGRGRGKTF